MSAETSMYRIGGLAAIAFGLAYLVIFPLYASVGAPPADAVDWLGYAAGKTNAWWAILGLSVLTDFLLVPVALALYIALGRADRNATLLGTAFIGLFVVLDLAVTWPNYAARIDLSEAFLAATSDAQRAAYVGAASYASTVLATTLVGVYSIATLSIGILLVSLVMVRGGFSPAAGYIGLATGVLGIVSVAGPVFVAGLGAAVILASVLTTLWALLVGYRLVRLGQASAVRTGTPALIT
jgi:hypothetical protein